MKSRSFEKKPSPSAEKQFLEKQFLEKQFLEKQFLEKQATERLQPRKDLGQNFLRDTNIAKNIVKSLEAASNDVILEIGPGEGALTSLLLQTPAKTIITVEYDTRAVELLSTKFRAEIAAGRLRIIHSDVLKLSLESGELGTMIAASNHDTVSSLKIVGNIPYYITSDILFWIFDGWANLTLKAAEASIDQSSEAEAILPPKQAVIMMQKEVAQRITSRPRTKDYGILSVASLLVSEPKILFHVPPSCFFPPPKVTSSVVQFALKVSNEAAEQFRQVHPLVRTAFNQRRKVLSNALSGILPKERLQDLLAAAEARNMNYFRARAEELMPQDFVRLWGLIQEFR